MYLCTQLFEVIFNKPQGGNLEAIEPMLKALRIFSMFLCCSSYFKVTMCENARIAINHILFQSSLDHKAGV